MIKGFEFIGECKWREVVFIYTSSKTTGARKTALKKFPNTDLQLVEDLGGSPQSFTLNGIISPLQSEDTKPVNPVDEADIPYLDRRDLLIDALEEEGTGILVHPLHGTIHNLVVTGYSLDETVTELGIGRITIDFEVSNFDGAPIPDPTATAQIASDTDIVMEKVEASVELAFNADPKLLGVFAAAKGKLEDAQKAFKKGVAFVEKTTDGIEKVATTIADFQDDLVALARVPGNLAKSITNVFSTIAATVSTAIGVFDAFKSFFGFGFLTDIDFSFGTSSNKAKKSNNRVINNAINVNALVGSYLAVANKTHKTTNDIDSDVLILETQINSILSAPELDPEVLDALLTARQNIMELLTERKQSVSQIITIETTLITPRALSYIYYGDDSEANDISKLNLNNGLFLEGDVKIFSS